MAKKESSFKNMTLTLLLVAGIAGSVLGGVYIATKDAIAAADAKKIEDAIAKVAPEFDRTEIKKVAPADGSKDSLTFYSAFKNDELVGVAIETYTDKGFSGRFKIMVGFLPDGTIHNTAVLEHAETPGLGDKMDAKISDFPNQFMGKHPDKYKMTVTKDGGEVDAITAATITSRAFCDAATRAFETFKQQGGMQ